MSCVPCARDAPYKLSEMDIEASLLSRETLFGDLRLLFREATIFCLKKVSFSLMNWMFIYIQRRPRGETTVKTLGLNRKDLREYRSKAVKRLLCLADLARKNAEALGLLNEIKVASEEYAAFARALASEDCETEQ